MKKTLVSSGAPAALGPYSPALQSGEMIFCSGQLALVPGTDRLVEGGVEAETRRVLENLRALLAAAALDFSDVVKTTIFLADLKDFDVVNRIYSEHLSAPYPARSTVQAAALPMGARIEIEMIAMRR